MNKVQLLNATVSALSDMDTSNLADGQALIWNAASGKWKPGTVAASGANAATITYGADANTILSCAFEGPDASGSIVDDISGAAAYFNTVGSAQISTEQKKFGTSSCKFLPGGWSGAQGFSFDRSNLAITGDFTIEAFFYPISSGYYIGLICDGASASWRIYAQFNGATTFYIYGSNQIRSASSPNQNAWNHVALVRSNGVVSLYLNGVQGGTFSWSGALSSKLFLGADMNGWPFQGYMDDLRVSNVARYSGQSFTVPTATLGAQPIFPNPATQGQMGSDGTYLYICTASGSPGTWKRVPLSSF